MERITITNALGASIVFDYRGGGLYDNNGEEIKYETTDGTHAGRYYLIDWNGYNPTINPTTTQGYQQHGETLQNIFLGTRRMKLKVLICADVKGFFADTMSFFYQIRKQMWDVLNPLLGEITLTYMNDYRTRMITAHCSVLPQETTSYGTGREFEMELVATQPFWRDESDTIITLQRSHGGLRFGTDYLYFDPDQIFGEYATAETFTYSGDAPTPVEITIRAERECINPRVVITNRDGTHYCGVNATLTENDVFVINTAYGNKSVTLNGKNAMRYLTSGSTFFDIIQGDNTLAMSSESGGAAIIEVRFNNFYVEP